VLFVGALVEAKGVRTLLRAVRGVPGLQIELVGPPDPVFLASLATEREALGERLAVRGACSPDEVDRALARADLFVLPSRREGFPIGLLEAMAVGLPVIATPVGAVPEIVRTGVDGLLVPVDDEPALMQALTQLATDRALRSRLGVAGRARVTADFAASVVVPRLVALWTELASAGSRTA
jgi:glycosyltransferase involved in cell wall biosynthesis